MPKDHIDSHLPELWNEDPDRMADTAQAARRIRVPEL